MSAIRDYERGFDEPASSEEELEEKATNKQNRLDDIGNEKFEEMRLSKYE